MTFHALATAIAFRRTSKAAEVWSLHTLRYVLVGCNKTEIKDLNFPLSDEETLMKATTYFTICLFLYNLPLSFVFI